MNERKTQPIVCGRESEEQGSSWLAESDYQLRPSYVIPIKTMYNLKSPLHTRNKRTLLAKHWLAGLVEGSGEKEIKIESFIMFNQHGKLDT